MMLCAALGMPAPRYGHHSLILAPDGSKLSKRHGATSIGDFRALGYLPGAMVNYLALLSWHPADEREKFSLAELIEEFELERVSKSPAIFDVQKLNWLNGLYIRELEPADLYELVTPYLAEAGIELAPVQREVVAAAIQANLSVLGDAPRYAAPFVEDVDATTGDLAEWLLHPGTEILFELAKETFGAMAGEYLPAADARDLLRGLVEAAKQQGLKGKAVYHPLRVALSGGEEGPELFYLVGGLGKSTILARLEKAAAFVAEKKGI
jgi:nondiscriminating glutamyl-tRNA synthetase